MESDVQIDAFEVFVVYLNNRDCVHFNRKIKRTKSSV